MTPDQKAALKSAGWTQVNGDAWRSPLTQRDFSESEALSMLALADIRKRRAATLYRPRQRHFTR